MALNKLKGIRIILLSISVALIAMFGAFSKKDKYPDNPRFRKNIQFNHLFVVIDDSTYKYLLDSLKFPGDFAKTSEESVSAGSASWTGKYIYGISNYLEIIKPGSLKGSALGNIGLGFITDKFGTIDSLQSYWTKTLDSVHTENRVITDNGKTSPWYKSISVPNIDSLKISAWVFENSKEEMSYAGFTESDLSKEIEYSEYYKHIRAKFRKIPVDSIKNDRLFDKLTSLALNLSSIELSYLRKSLLDIGFTKKNNSFSKDKFIITYSVTESPHFLLKEIWFSLLKEVPKKSYSLRKIDLIMDGDIATMKFKY
jgi:hypothetical protein